MGHLEHNRWAAGVVAATRPRALIRGRDCMDHGTSSGGDILRPLSPTGRPGPDTGSVGAVREEAGPAITHRRARRTRWQFPVFWPLAPVLAVQSVLSLRLVRADTAFQDEALYLWAGHQQWAHRGSPAGSAGAPVASDDQLGRGAHWDPSWGSDGRRALSRCCGENAHPRHILSVCRALKWRVAA